MTELRFRQGKSDSAARKVAEQVSDSRHPVADKDQPRPSIDAVARIFRPTRSVMTSARVSRRPWLLVFERRVPPTIDYFMGYTGGSDTLSQIELRFPSREAAIAYAERQKLNYIVVGDRRR